MNSQPVVHDHVPAGKNMNKAKYSGMPTRKPSKRRLLMPSCGGFVSLAEVMGWLQLVPGFTQAGFLAETSAPSVQEEVR